MAATTRSSSGVSVSMVFSGRTAPHTGGGERKKRNYGRPDASLPVAYRLNRFAAQTCLRTTLPRGQPPHYRSQRQNTHDQNELLVPLERKPMCLVSALPKARPLCPSPGALANHSISPTSRRPGAHEPASQTWSGVRISGSIGCDKRLGMHCAQVLSSCRASQAGKLGCLTKLQGHP